MGEERSEEKMMRDWTWPVSEASYIVEKWMKKLHKVIFYG
jgi:hypothetical protein